LEFLQVQKIIEVAERWLSPEEIPEGALEQIQQVLEQVEKLDEHLTQSLATQPIS